MEGEHTEPQLLSLDEQVNLARTLSKAVDAANEFVARMGGFDDFAEVHQHVDDNRAQFDALEKARNEARQTFDEMVRDKPALVKHLRGLNEIELADRIKRMFQIR